MPIDDGYGDETPEQTALRFLRWSHDAASKMTHADSLIYDDLVQEAMISIWRTAETKHIRNAVYLTKTARYRMVDVASGERPMTGGDSTPGPRYRPKETSVDWEEISADPGPLEALLEAADLLDAVELAYHHGEICEALDGLREDHRRYVVERFWHGKRDVEIAAEMEVDKRLLNLWWRRTIRPALAERLQHLQEAL